MPLYLADLENNLGLALNGGNGVSKLRLKNETVNSIGERRDLGEFIQEPVKEKQ